MHQRPALNAREDGAVDFFGNGLVVHQDDAAAWATQTFVGGRGDHIRMRHGVGIDARSDQTRVVGHVHHEIGTNGFGYFGKTLKVNAQAVGRRAGDDEFGFLLMGQALHGVVVNRLVRIEPVTHHLEPFAAHVQRHAMGQMAAFGQAHAHDGVAGLEQTKENGLVGLRAGVGLHIGELGAEKRFDAVDGQLLGHVHILTTAVITFAGITFSVLVGELATLGLHDSR